MTYNEAKALWAKMEKEGWTGFAIWEVVTTKPSHYVLYAIPGTHPEGTILYVSGNKRFSRVEDYSCAEVYTEGTIYPNIHLPLCCGCCKAEMSNKDLEEGRYHILHPCPTTGSVGNP